LVSLIIMLANIQEQSHRKLTDLDMSIQFNDIFILEEIQRMQDMFSDATGVASIITLPNGKPITKPSIFTRFCHDIIRTTEKGCANCIKSDAHIGSIINAVVVQHCLSAGLWDAGVPITVNGIHIASWLIGQVQTEDVDLEKMKAYADEIGADRTEFLEALAEVPKMTKARFNKVAEMLNEFAKDLSEKGYVNLQLKNEISEHEKANVLLQKSQESLYITLHSIGDGVITTNKLGEISDMNPVAEQLCGWKLSQAEGKHLTEVFNIVNAGTRKPVDNPVSKVLENGQIVGLANHTVLISRDKTEYQIADSAAPIKNCQGEITGVVLVFSDITEKYEAEEVQRHSDKRYRALLNQLEAGVVVHAPDTSIISSNPRASEILGLSVEQMEGKLAIHPDWQFFAESKTALPIAEYPVNKIIATKKPIVDFVIGIYHPHTNEFVWVLVNGFPMLDSKGEITEVLISFIDITHRKQSEELMKSSREAFKELYDNAPVGYHELDIDGKIVRINNTELTMLGYENEELLGRYGWEFLENKEFSRKSIFGKLAGTIIPTESVERRFLRKDGTPVIFLIKDNILKDSNGKITGIRSTVQDITKWKQTEFALQASEKKHSILFMESPDAYFTIVDGIFVDCNKESERILRGSRAQIIGQTPESLSPEFQPDGRKSEDAIKENLEITLQNGIYTFEWMHHRFDGSDLYLEVTLAEMILDGKMTVFSTWRDISKRKLAEETLDNERLLLRTLIDNMPDVIYSKDLECRKTLANIADVRNMGATAELEVLGKTDFEVFPKEIADNFYADDKLVLQNGKPVLNREEYIIDNNGEKRWLLTSKLPLFNKDNQIVGLVGIGRDITIRRKAEQALRESESFLKDTQMIAKLGTYTMDLSTGKWISSEVLDKIFGIDDNYDKNTTSWVAIVHPDWQKTMADYFANEVVAKKLKFNKEYRIVRQNDKVERWVHGIGELYFNDKNEIVRMIGTIQDITEIKQNESALAEQSDLQQMLIRISAEYINLPLDGIETAIQKSLHQLAKFVGADRAYIFDYDFAKQISINTYEWCEPDIDPHIQNLHSVTTSEMSDWPEIHGRGEAIFIPDVFALPLGQIRNWLEPQDIKSLITVPMMIKDKCIGFVGFDSVKKHRYYSENEKYLLVSYAQILVNVRQRLQAEETLQNERLLLRTVIDNIPDTIYAKDLNFNKTLANKAEVNLLGANSEEDVIGRTDDAFYDHEFAHNFMEDDQIVLKTGVPDYNREGFIFDGKGQKHWFLSSKLPLRNKNNQIVGLVGISHDITNRRQAEEALRKSEEKYRNIFENVQDVFYRIDMEGTILEMSPSIKYFTEFICDNWVGTSVNVIYSNPEDRKLFLTEVLKHREVRDYELSFKTTAGAIKQVSINARVNYDENGIPTHIDGAIRDITKRKLAEIALRESDKKFHDYVDFAPHGIFVVDNTGTYVDVNAAATQITGYSKEELLKIKQKDLLAEESHLKFNIHSQKVITEGFATDEYTIVRKDGSTGFCKVDTVKLSEDRYLGFVVDITKRRNAEEALSNSQRELKKFAAHLQNVREEERIMLAREIHDELGQILIAIKIDTGLLKQKVLKVVDSINYMEIMSKFDNLFGLVDNTINTARKIMTDLRPEVLYLLGFEEAVKLHISKFQERHNIECLFYTEEFKLELAEQQSVALYRIVQEALTNIVKHAKATKVDIHINLIDNVLTLEINDNGIGFDQNHKVKSDSYGMIGMKERVYLLGGELNIVGNQGKGTTVRVLMPY